MKVDFEDVGAVFGKGKDGVVFELFAIVEFELDTSQ